MSALASCKKTCDALHNLRGKIFKKFITSVAEDVRMNLYDHIDDPLLDIFSCSVLTDVTTTSNNIPNLTASFVEYRIKKNKWTSKSASKQKKE